MYYTNRIHTCNFESLCTFIWEPKVAGLDPVWIHSFDYPQQLYGLYKTHRFILFNYIV